MQYIYLGVIMTNNSRLTIVMILLGIIGLCVWAFQNERYSNAPSLTVNRKQAIGYAMHYLDTQDKLPSQILQVHAKVFRNRPDNNARNLYYVWQKDGPDVYNKLTDKYIYPTSWLVSIYADTVNYHVYLNGNGKAYRTTIEFAYPLASTSKTKDDAVKYALDSLQTDKSTNIDTLTLFKADSTLIHGRTDWTIQFQDDSLRYLTDSQLFVAV